MRAPIGIRISSRRKALGIAQARLARQAGISPSYLNLIERNKRDVGGALLKRIAEALDVDLDSLTGEAEQKLIQDLEEAFSDPVLETARLSGADARDLVAQHPAAAQAIAQLHRAYGAAVSMADAYANRLRADPLFSQLLHQILSGVTAVRSGAEILSDVDDLSEAEQRRFVAAISRETKGLADVAQTLVGQFERSSETRRSALPLRELDDLIIAENSHFATLEETGDQLRAALEREGPFGEASLTGALQRRFGVRVERGPPADTTRARQYGFMPETRTFWFRNTAKAATRQFQLARLYGELAAPDMLDRIVRSPRLTTEAARRLGHRALSSYLASTIVFPYSAFLDDAEALRYDIEALCETYAASFEQVAQRLVSLRRPGAEGVPFGFLRSDPAGRLTKHFPLPGLLLPNSGHACPLWAIYAAFRSPETTVRQTVRFVDGSRYLFIARTQAYRTASFRHVPLHTSVMLACDVLHADRTIYGSGLDVADSEADVPVGPTCRLCTRRECLSRQEDALAPEETVPPAAPRSAPAAVRSLL